MRPDGTTAATPPWHGLAVDEVLRRLETDASLGLDDASARSRRMRLGPNEIETARGPSWPRILARQFASVLVAILAAAAIVSVAIGESVDAAAIAIILVANGLLGFVQEWRAERTLAALARMLAPRCRVVRGGRVLEIDAAELVPGDVVLLDAGDRVPADLRLVECHDLEVDESALSGESLPVAKSPDPVDPDAPLTDRRDMAYMGTSATRGTARGVVVATGMATEFGRIARLAGNVEHRTTPLQRRLARLGRQLGVAAVGVAAAIVVAGSVAGHGGLEMFMLGVSLAVAVVPEGLPAVVTVTLALGVWTMARRGALVRRLPAVETLGTATVVCTDKTGTLTQNRMAVERIHTAGGWIDVTAPSAEHAFSVAGRPIDPPRRPDLWALLESGATCNDAAVERREGEWVAIGDPTEGALAAAAARAGVPGLERDRRVGELPFDAKRKRMTVVEDRPDGPVAHVKGAPETILSHATHVLDGTVERPIRQEDRDAAWAAASEMAGDGLRTLAVARRRLAPETPLDAEHVERDLTLLGIVGLSDPPRPEVPDAVRKAQRAGIRVVMVTGDAGATATAIARRVGIEVSSVVTGVELDGMDDETLRRRLRDPRVLFARTTPEHKLRIVAAYQDLGHVVAMTGDGVNDAPALRRADIGIAMGQRGTDVAKAAADMVLTDDNFASIVRAIEEGRRQYDNVQKFVRYLLCSNAAEIVAIAAGVLAGGPLVLLPVQILWVNLLTDGVTAVALGAEPPEADVMDRPPRPPNARVVNREGFARVAVLGGYMGLATFGVFLHASGGGTEVELTYAHSMAFTTLVVVEKTDVFNFRSLRTSIVRTRWSANPWLLVAWASMLGLHLCALYVPALAGLLHARPLAARDWAIVAGLAAPVIVLGELWKFALRRRTQTATP